MTDSRPYLPQTIAQGIKQRVLAYKKRPGSFITSHGIRGVIVSLLNDACCGDEGRYYLLEFLFGKSSTKDLDDEEWWALGQWVSPHKEPLAGKEIWSGNKWLWDECEGILDAMGYNIDRHAYMRQKHGIVKEKMIESDNFEEASHRPIWGVWGG